MLARPPPGTIRTSLNRTSQEAPGGPRPSAQTTTAALGIVTVVLTLVGWSSVPLFLRHFADSIDLWTSNGWRYGFSALLWLPVLLTAAWIATGPWADPG